MATGVFRRRWDYRPRGRRPQLLSTPTVARPERVRARVGARIVRVPRTAPEFPIVELPMGVEMAFGAAGFDPTTYTWTDVTDQLPDRLLRQNLTSKRGRSDLAAETTPGALDVTLDNSDGAFTPRNPSSPYWPNVRRGTPLRQWIDAGTQSLLLGGGGWADTPDHPDFAVTDLDIRIKVDPIAWSTAVDWSLGNGARSLADTKMRFASKWDIVNFDDISWVFSLHSAGWPSAEWSPDGAAVLIHWSDQLLAFRSAVWLAMVIDVDDGAGGHTVTIYSTEDETPAADVTTWTVVSSFLGSGTTTIAPSDGALAVGVRNSIPTYVGRIDKFEMRDGINGPIVADPDFAGAEIGDTVLEDSTGKVWELRGTAEISNRRYRYVGTVDSWTGPEWPLGDNEPDNAIRPSESRVTATSAGVLRRLGQGDRNKPLRSTLFRHITSDRLRPYVLAYWPCEAQKGAAEIGSGLAGGVAFPITGAELAANDELLASAALPTVQADDVGEWAIPIPPGTVGATRWVVDFIWRIDTPAVDPAFTRLITLRSDGAAGGPALWEWDINDTVSRVLAYDVDGTEVESNTLAIDGNDFGDFIIGRFDAQQDGADIDWSWRITNIDRGTSLLQSDTIVGSTLGTLLEISNEVTGPTDGFTFGHIVVTDGSVLGFNWLTGADTAWVGETAAHRIWRLCNEEAIPVEVIGDPGAFSGGPPGEGNARGDVARSQPMGPQERRSLLQLLRSAAELDMGVIIERRGIPGLRYRTRRKIEAQEVRLQLDAARDHRGDIINPIEPRLDDQGPLLNDVTIMSRFGSSAQVIDQADVDAEGRYDTDLTLDGIGGVDVQDAILGQFPRLGLAVSTQNVHQASWRVHLGTWPELRWPSVNIPIEVIALLYPEIIDIWLDVELGDRLQIVNLPVQYPDDAVELIVNEIREIASSNRWRPALACSAGGPWLVTKLEGATKDLTLPRLADDGAVTLTAAINSTATSIALSGTDLTEVANNYPLDVIIGGERITAGGNTAQTLTSCTRSVNGVVKSHSAGDVVTIAYPTVLALGTV